MIETSGNSLAFWSPWTVAALCAVAVVLLWRAVVTFRRRPLDARMHDYLLDSQAAALDIGQPFTQRVINAGFRRILRALAALLPQRNVARLRQLLVYAGEPGGLTVMDFTGLRLLAALVVGGLVFWVYGRQQAGLTMLLSSLLGGFAGYMLLWLWLRGKARRRQWEIQRALPDALDMLTIAVEAGLAFESGLLRVGEQWHNVLSEEFRRVVGEMRMGVTRTTALERLVARTNVEELATFVAVLVQSTNLGVSMAQVLQTQAAQMRIRRRQRAEELARKASVKIVLVLMVFFFPIIFVVLLGPMVPQLMGILNGMQRR